ncbi:MAG TPA: LuxR C-terminal-related transcriptional regulator [Trebonia sp.]|nr:LuxR C-terminal-related transcriptional regulator [Trebonia sp.]
MSFGLAARSAGQLPEEVTGFVGREAELSQIAALLDTTRLVTVTGPGGVGKTRVVLRVAAQLAGRYRDGACLAELSALRDGQLLPSIVAAALGLPDVGAGAAGTEAVLRHLRDREILLILDTCEHLLDACALLAEAILTHAPGVSVLATSRQPLDVPGESACPLPPLSVPGQSPAGTGLAGPVPAGMVPGPRGPAVPGMPGTGDAVELFTQRAMAVVPGFAVTTANKDAVIALCRQLDGIPLAIELAAVRLRALPLSELTAALDGRFQVMTGSRRAAPRRHQTLWDAVGWSYDLCSPAEQALWARLSVFAGSFDIDAVEEVCARDDDSMLGHLTRDEITETVIRLVDKSVLAREPVPAPGAGPAATRYRLLDTIRQFGLAHLAASGDEARIRDQHVARYLRLARHFSEHILDDQLGQFRRLRAEHANIRAALEHALGQPDGAALAISLWGYWQVSGLLSEGRYWLEKVLRQSPGPCRERAWALVLLGYLGAFQGRGGEAVARAAEGIAVAVAAGDELAVARGHLYHMMALAFAGRHEEAGAAEAEAGRRLQALGDRIGLHSLDAQAGQLCILRGDPTGAIARAEEGLARFGDAEEHWLSSYLHTIIGMSRFQVPGQEPGASAAMTEALRAKFEIGDTVGTAYSLEVLAWLAARAGLLARAAWLLGAAQALWAKVGGRLAGSEMLEGQHRAAEAAARAGLGQQRYDGLHAAGGRRPLPEIVALALDGAPDLPSDPIRAPAAAGLTSREREIAGLVASGLSNRQIAERMVISKRTVDAHVEHIFGKLSISSRIQLTNWVREGAVLPAGRPTGPAARCGRRR